MKLLPGVGDVCSFSQMDIKRHGNPDWMAFGMTSGAQIDQANNGKTELSLINFSIRNPAWKPQENEAMYISTIKALGINIFCLLYELKFLKYEKRDKIMCKM